MISLGIEPRTYTSKIVFNFHVTVGTEKVTLLNFVPHLLYTNHRAIVTD